ncbi:MAG TPA: hypothetical protein VH024_09930 [Candidatus Angelobacter sp.]|jgi:hypothetical protein|nr:hypothetical protein [Candidatus Angelobacter sp.]
MNPNRGLVSGTVGLMFLFAMGVWAAAQPEGWVRYFLKNKIDVSPDDTRLKSLLRFIGICLAIFAAVCIAATFATR